MQTENRTVVTRVQAEGRVWTSCLKGMEFRFVMMKKVLEMNSGDGYT